MGYGMIMGKNIKQFRRNVLMAGRPGFLADFLKNCLNKEGWDTSDYREESFNLYNPSAVMYFSDGKEEGSLSRVLEDIRTHKVEHFLYVTRGLSVQKCYEDFVLAWGKTHQQNVSVVHMPEVFGQGQQPDEGTIARLLTAAWEKKDFYLAGSDIEPASVLYAKDAAYALFSILQKKINNRRIVVESQETVSFTQIVLTVNGFAQLPQIEVAGKGEDFFVANSWQADEEDTYHFVLKTKYPVLEMLKPVYKSLADSAETVEHVGESWKTKYLPKIRPYLENIGLFLVVLFISILQGGTPVNQATGLDICYIYIIIMGIIYGKKQSMPAVLLCIALLTWVFLNNHGEFASIFYISENLFHYSTYLFFGVFTGYIADGWQWKLESMGYKLDHMYQRYGFLQKNYEKSIEIKDKLYYQIVNSDDSIGWLYGIIQQLDTVQVENIFTQAAVITSKIMRANNIAIYVMGKDQYYLRQKVRLGDKTRQLPHSRKTEENAYIRNMLENHHLFVNHGLQLNLPDLAAPIIYNGQVIAIIEIYGMDFDQWSIYQQNLLSVTARLISMAMGKAYVYENGIQNKRFVADTRIMQEEEFARHLAGIKERAQLQHDVHNVLLELGTENVNYQELDNRLSGSIRQEDTVGIMDGNVYLLLHDTDEYGLQLVKQRLQHRGIEIKDIRELV